MRHLLITLVTLVAVAEFNVNAGAQSACTAYFTSYLYPFYLLNIPGTHGMTSRQEKWFHKKGQKKYPNLCEDREKATYIFVTSGQIGEVQQPVTVTRHAYTTGPVTETIGQTASGPTLPPPQQIWGTRLETFITTWQEKETRTVHKFHANVFLIMTKKPLAEAVSQDDYLPPMLAAQADGYDADRVALEQAFSSVIFVGAKK